MPRFSELSAVPTAMPLTGEPQSAMTPRQADFPQSQRQAVPSLEQERTFLPRSTMAVSKIPASKQRLSSDRQHGRQIDKASHFPRQTQLHAPSHCPQSATSHPTWGRKPQNLERGSMWKAAAPSKTIQSRATAWHKGKLLPTKRWATPRLRLS